MYEVEKCLLIDLLNKSNMSQRVLADHLGVSKQQINAYVKNRQHMSYKTAYNISKVLDCSMDDLYSMSLASKSR